LTLEAARRERDSFVERVRDWVSSPGPLHGFFHRGTPIGVARAPGRLDVMGGIADYSGSLVLELPIREAALVAAQFQPEPIVRAMSLDGERGSVLRDVSLPSAMLFSNNYVAARSAFDAQKADSWAAYVAGTLMPLTAHKGLRHAGGARILVASRVPEGKGVASSAAIEVAAIFALAAAGNLELEGREAALLCHQVENLVVGAPCGVMDQMTAACGTAGNLLELLCQPASILGHHPLPAELSIAGIDSGVRHAVRGAEYVNVRAAAFMGYRLLAEAAGTAASETDHRSNAHATDLRWGGFLANVNPSELEAGLFRVLPERMSGAEFLARHHGNVDTVTEVDPRCSYPVRAATAHPIYEHHRVRLFSELLRMTPNHRIGSLLGELMYQSHESYGACGLGSDGTDAIVRIVQNAGPRAGLYGAKITGGGSGGTVAILARADAGEAVESVARLYEQETGRVPYLFSGSSSGAAELGATVVRL
jgi:galactokinase